LVDTGRAASNSSLDIAPLDQTIELGGGHSHDVVELRVANVIERLEWRSQSKSE
jgi:hypothetical protein